MPATAYGRWGRMVEDPSPEEIAEILAELDGPEDDEHPDVWIDHDSGWSLSAFSSGLLIWEKPEPAPEECPFHMKDVPRALIERLFLALAADDLETMHKQPWSPGYG
ncbi:hypothetical protein [Thermomonospora amylolytica]|uniref:hypothetical protein n=1 Tax=Thermomonospora amylolytica TaxID=1411117 RepID=UPI00130051DF|nr:hypothetical protein [Thermomonospora amylolytica]